MAASPVWPKGMAKVVAEGYSFGEVFVGPRERAMVREICIISRVWVRLVEVISVGSDKYLGLVHEAAEGLAWIMRSLSRWNSLRTPSGASGLWRPALDSQAHVPLMPGVCVWGSGFGKSVTGGVSQDVGADDPQDASPSRSQGGSRGSGSRSWPSVGPTFQGASGRRRLAVRHSWSHAAEVRGEVQGLGGLVELTPQPGQSSSCGA